VAVSFSSKTCPAFSSATTCEVSIRRLQTLVNRRFDDVEVPGRLGLGMAGVEEGTDVGISDFRRRHRLLP